MHEEKNFYIFRFSIFRFWNHWSIFTYYSNSTFYISCCIFFEQSSEKFYNWLLTNKYFGEHLKDYRVNKGITKKNKIIAIISTIFGMTLGMFFMPFIIGKILLLLILVGVIFHIISVDTIKK